MEPKRIAMLGDGGWGTAMSTVLAGAGHSVTMWSHDPEYLRAMESSRENTHFLPGIRLPDSLAFEPDMAKALAAADVVAVAIPSKFLRATLSRAGVTLPPEKACLSLTKGMDADTLELPSQVIRECLGAAKVAVLSGPSHAEEVARGLPASLVAASDELATARDVQHIVTTPRFRVYASGDRVGVEIGGATKNVIALAAGIAHGMDLGDNALSALATRGLVEMTRLGTAMGGEAATFSGLAGMGDLITTCFSPHGRNRAVGIRLAKGETLEQILASMNGVPESVTTTASVLALAKQHYVDMPITEQVAAVLWQGKSPVQAVHDLMTRAKKDEI